MIVYNLDYLFNDFGGDEEPQSSLFDMIHYDDPFTGSSCARIPFSTEVGIQIGRAIADIENNRFYVHQINDKMIRMNYVSADGSIDQENWVDTLCNVTPTDDVLGKWEVIRRRQYPSPYTGVLKVEYAPHPTLQSIRNKIRKDQDRQGKVRVYFSKQYNDYIEGDVFVYPTSIDLGTQLTYATSKHTIIRLLCLNRHICLFGGSEPDMAAAVATGYNLESAYLNEEE